MSLYITEDSKEIKKILMKFREKYKEALGYNIAILNDHIKHDELGVPLTNAFLCQIYEAAGLTKPSCSIYHQMTELIKKNFNLKRDIVEIGSGIFPILGHNLSECQLKLGKGSVTVYDANVWTEYPTKAKLVNGYFNDRVKLQKNSLLVSLFPCQSTQMIIDKAKQEDLEFCIALCGCNHSDNPFLSTKEYHEMLINQLMAQISPEKLLKVKYFPKACFGNRHHGFPILMVKDKPKVKIFSYLKKLDDNHN